MRKQFHWTTLATLVASSLGTSPLSATTHQSPNFSVSSQVQSLPSGARKQEMLAARATSSGMESQYDAKLGKATFVWQAIGQREPNLSPIKPEERVSYAADFYFRKLTGIGSGRTLSAVGGAAKLHNMHTTKRGASVAKYKQYVQDIEVFNREYNVLMDKQYNLVSGSGYLADAKQQAKGFALLANFAPPEGALQTAIMDAGQTKVVLTPTEVRGDYQHFTAKSLTKNKTVLGSPRAKKVFYEHKGELKAAYYVEVNVEDSAKRKRSHFSYVIDAVNDKIYFRKDLASHAEFSYRIHANEDGAPWESPHGDVVPADGASQEDETEILDAPLVSLSHYEKLSTQDPWLTEHDITTEGNNVFAYSSSFPDLANGVSISSNNTFDYPYNPELGVTHEDNAKAAAVNAFYITNYLHDFFYDHGFDETSNVAQRSNYGRGGLEGDPLQVRVRDGIEDNAYMSTPADGESPTMYHYLWSSKDAKPDVNWGVALTSHPELTIASGHSYFGLPEFLDVTGELVRINDGDTSGDWEPPQYGSVYDGCQPAVNNDALAGKIALIDASGCDVSTAVLNAQNAGAKAAIYMGSAGQNYTPNMYPGVEAFDDALAVNIPNMAASGLHAQALYDALEEDKAVTVTMFAKNLYKDSAFDNAITAHEWGHYISNRLVGNASGLVNAQGRAMGEGWGDFHGLMFMAKASDINIDGNDLFQKGYGNSSFVASFYNGVRRVPYSTQMSINPLTFKHITEGEGEEEGIEPTLGGYGHGAGEIWATMLWESYVALINLHGFTVAQQRMADYLVAGYKMTPIAPTYTEARDAILSVALASDEQDFHTLKAAFAKRGMGVGAVAPDRWSDMTLQGVEESFLTEGAIYRTSGIALEADYDGTELGYCTQDKILDNGETGTLRITLQNTGTEPLENVKARVTVVSDHDVTFPDGDMVTFAAIDTLQEVVSEPIKLTLNGAQTFDTLELAVVLPEAEEGDSIAEGGDKHLAVIVNYGFRGRDPVNGSDRDDMESITLYGNWHERSLKGEDGLGTRTVDSGEDFQLLKHQGFDLGEQAMRLRNNDFESDVVLESNTFTVGKNGDFKMTFWHFYALEKRSTESYELYPDGGVIEIKVDDGEWQDVTEAGGTFDVGYNGVIGVDEDGRAIEGQSLANRMGFVNVHYGRTTFSDEDTINFGEQLNGKEVQLRFRIATDTAGASEYVGWLIDNVEFSNIASPVFTEMVAGDDEALTCDDTKPVVQSLVGDDDNDGKGELTATAGNSVTLTVTATDRNEVLTYQWTQVSGTNVTIDDADKANASIVAPDVTTIQTLEFEVSITDGVTTLTRSVQVTVNPAPVRPAQPPAQVVTKSGGGGSTELWALLLLPMAIIRRLTKN